jgi:hypothetical protein
MGYISMEDVMKKRISILAALLFGLAGFSFADGFNVYSFFVNIMPETYHGPLVGFVNVARGEHHAPQIGFVNWNTGAFNSLQMSFVNMAGGEVKGAQIGFVNTAAGNLAGADIGFVNTTMGDVTGAQAGFVNTATGGLAGLQYGFVNTAMKNTAGAQLGFVNTTLGTTAGFQFGFLSTALDGITGGQVSLVNITKKLSGLQFGLVNYADSLDGGLPIGLISIVRKGGYHAVELSFDEGMPLNIALKLGIEKFYTSFIVSYDPAVNAGDTPRAAFGFGAGFGSIWHIGETQFFANPEIDCRTTCQFKQQFLSLRLLGGYRLNSHVSVVAGPAFTWMHVADGSDNTQPVFKAGGDVDGHNSLMFGVKAGLRLRF